MRVLLILLSILFQTAYAADYYVSASGQDDSGDGSAKKPWRTIGYALQKVEGHKGHTIHISEGIFYEPAALSLPPQTNLRGAGMDLTIIKGLRTFYYHPSNPGFEPGRFILRLDGPLDALGNQALTDFTIDGSDKQIHGGIYINGRSNILVENVKIKQTNFCGIWILNVKDVEIRKVSLLNCAWGSNEWCSGAFQLAYADGLEIDRLDIDEGTGYGIKTLGHDAAHILRRFRLHDSRISVNPKGLWQNGKAPNIAIEIWANSFAESEIYNCYFDNHISIVNSDHATLPSGKIFRIHHNMFDILSRAKGEGYGIELTIHDAEIDHNIFKGGFSGISNWSHSKTNWSIHHNIFYGISSTYPTGIINAYKGNLKNVNIYNNTVELFGTTTVNFLQCGNGGVSEDVVIKNNLIINSNTAYSHYANRFINLEKQATIKDLVVENNYLCNLPLGKLNGIVKNNLSGDPKIKRIGTRPFPYYLPASKSPLINAQPDRRRSFTHQSSSIGAYESSELSQSFFAE
jgi:hypothetical protein